MVDEPGSPDDLYRYNGRHKLKAEANIKPGKFYTSQTRQHRQDSGIGFSTFTDAIHYENVGMLFAPQATVSMQAVPEIQID